MSATLSLPILGLENEFPASVFVLYHSNTKRYGCYCHHGVHGLACFSTNAGAVKFGEFIDLDGLSVMQLSFDEAREVAKERPLPVTALMLLDNMNDPKVHYIR
jgi:hypothetical protein